MQNKSSVTGYLKLIATALITIVLTNSCHQRIGIGVKPGEGIPLQASNGCYYNSSWFLLGPPAYYKEYDITEAEFLKIYPKLSFKEARLSEEPVSVPRYLKHFVLGSDFYNDNQTFEEQSEGEKRCRELIEAQIKDGLYYFDSVEDTMTWITYDRKRQRAFIYYSTR